jgi:hypothetical protein
MDLHLLLKLHHPLYQSNRIRSSCSKSSVKLAHQFTHVAKWLAFQAVRNARLPGGTPDRVPD